MVIVVFHSSRLKKDGVGKLQAFSFGMVNFQGQTVKLPGNISGNVYIIIIYFKHDDFVENGNSFDILYL